MQNITLPGGAQLLAATVLSVNTVYTATLDDGNTVGMLKKPKVGQLAIIADDGSYQAIDNPLTPVTAGGII